jgi:hypothetical protein
MQSPAPQKQKIASRSDSSEESTDDIIENIEAVTEEDKKQEAEESSDSSDSTITEREIGTELARMPSWRSCPNG